MDSQPFKRLFLFVVIVVLMSFNHARNYFYEMRIGRWVDAWLWLELTHHGAIALVLVDFNKEILRGELVF